jgi:membrane protein implicated in regulation of membrane protease activity
MSSTGRTILIALGVVLLGALFLSLLVMTGMLGVLGLIVGADQGGSGWLLAVVGGLTILAAVAAGMLVAAGPRRHQQAAEPPRYQEDNVAGTESQSPPRPGPGAPAPVTRPQIPKGRGT